MTNQRCVCGHPAHPPGACWVMTHEGVCPCLQYREAPPDGGARTLPLIDGWGYRYGWTRLESEGR